MPTQVAKGDPAVIRRSWKRAVQCSPALVAPSRYVSELMEFSLAISGPSLQVHYRRFRDHPEGRALLAERPDLPGTLADHRGLAEMPDGSLGRAYLDFVSQYRFDAAAFAGAHDIEGMGRRLGWDDDLVFVVTRGLQLHDLWHTLASYGPDWGGEAGVMALTYGQIPGVGVGIVAGILWALPGGVPRARWRAYLREARQRGRSAGDLLVARYEDLLPLPVDEARSRLGIAPMERAHPSGVPWSPFRYGLGKAMGQPYEPLARPGGGRP